MRTLFTNGKIYLKRNRFAEAILIEDKSIKKVGSLLSVSVDLTMVDGKIVYEK